MADLPILSLFAAAAEHGAAAAHEAEPVAFGIVGPGAWVALSMTVLIGVMLWKKVPAMIAGNLDQGIAEIARQLDEAKALRAEAEALRKEYADKIAGAERDAEAMLDHARHEAAAIVAKAQADTAAVIGRREKMAQDKIAAAERAAIADLRARAAHAAAQAAGGLIRSRYSAEADRALVDRAISGI